MFCWRKIRQQSDFPAFGHSMRRPDSIGIFKGDSTARHEILEFSKQVAGITVDSRELREWISFSLQIIKYMSRAKAEQLGFPVFG